VDGAVDLRRTLGVLKPGSTVALQNQSRGKLMDFKPSLTEMNPQITVGQELREGHECTPNRCRQGWGLTVPISRMRSVSPRAASRGAHIRRHGWR